MVPENPDYRGWGIIIATYAAFQARQNASGLSLIFAGGMRPDADAIAALAAIGGEGLPFAVTHRPDVATGWLELLAWGLAFDLSGLSPAAPEPAPPLVHTFGYDGKAPPDATEAVLLSPGSHLAGGQAMLPLVRTMAGLAARLAALPGVQGVSWHPARSLVEPALFIRMVAAWLGGGAFPALGLTALSRDPDGGLRSEGLSFFIGQEVRIEPFEGSPLPAAPRIAVRLIHSLVEDGPVHAPVDLEGPDGERLVAEPSANGAFVRVWRAG